MDPPSSAPNVPRSGEDLSRAFRNLPPGTLSGLDALCDHTYWLTLMRQAEIEISNEDIFRFRFAEISKTASNRLAFLAGSGEYGAFNLRYLIQQIVEQCADMHTYTRKLEKYVVKLQRRVEELEAEPRPAPSQQQQQREQQQREQQQRERAGGSSLASGGAGGSRGGGQWSVPPQRLPHSAAGGNHASWGGAGGPGKRPRSPPPPLGSVEAAGAAVSAEGDRDDDLR